MKFTLEEIFLECQIHVDELRTFPRGYFLSRGVKSNNLQIDKRRWDICRRRQPLNMPDSIHDYINLKMNEKFGWKVRNGIFCFGINIKSLSIINLSYGHTYIIFPCDTYRYVFDREKFDLYGYYHNNKPNNNIDDYEEFVENINYEEQCLKDVISNQIELERSVEVILNCNNYYLINLNYADRLIGMVWGI